MSVESVKLSPVAVKVYVIKLFRKQIITQKFKQVNYILHERRINMEKWIADVVGIMHVNKITNKDVAAKMQVTAEYVSMLLNEKKVTKTAEHDIRKAIDIILFDRKNSVAE